MCMSMSSLFLSLRLSFEFSNFHYIHVLLTIIIFPSHLALLFPYVALLFCAFNYHILFSRADNIPPLRQTPK